MPTHEPQRFFGKGPVLQAIDNLAAGLGIPELQNFFNVLSNPHGVPLVPLANQLGLGPPSTLQHLQDDWFGAWWPAHQPVEPIVRAGLAQAVWLAIHDPVTGQVRGQPLPIDALWLSGVDRFEVGLGASARQVTLLLLTPPVEETTPGLTAQDPVWMVHRGAARGDEDVISEQNGILTTRIRRRLGNAIPAA